MHKQSLSPFFNDGVSDAGGKSLCTADERKCEKLICGSKHINVHSVENICTNWIIVSDLVNCEDLNSVNNLFTGDMNCVEEIHGSI